jgi:hypothetical protein
MRAEVLSWAITVLAATGGLFLMRGRWHLGDPAKHRQAEPQDAERDQRFFIYAVIPWICMAGAAVIGNLVLVLLFGVTALLATFQLRRVRSGRHF